MIILYHIGFYQPYFQESKVWIQFYQNPSFGDKILTIQSLKIPCDPYKIHAQSSFHTKIQSSIQNHIVPYLGLIPLSSSSLLPLPLLYFSLFPLSRFVPFPNETNFWSLNHVLLRPCLALQKPIFGLTFSNCILVLHLLTICNLAYVISTLASNLVEL